MFSTSYDAMTKVSVILPVYNVEKYLRQCLDSVIGQTLKEIEIIAVDDGSTDGSPAILDEYAAREPRMKVIHQRNAGAGAARNAGLDAATGDYVIFFDPDDYVGEEMLRKLYDYANEVDADVACSGWMVHDEGTGTSFRRGYGDSLVRRFGVKTPAELGDGLFTTFGFAPWNKLVRRSFMIERNIRFQEIPRANDFYFSTASVALARRIAIVNGAYYHYRQSRQGGLVAGIDKTPLSLLDALTALKNKIESEKCQDSIVSAFRVMAARECVVKSSSFRSIAAVREFYGAMLESAVDSLGIRGLDEGKVGRELYPAYAAMCRSAPLDEFLRELLVVYRSRYENMRGRFHSSLSENRSRQRGGLLAAIVRRLKKAVS